LDEKHLPHKTVGGTTWHWLGTCLRIQIGNGGWTRSTGGALTSARALAESGLRGKALRNAVADQAARHVEPACLTEQLPHPDNRVVLDAQDKDFYGVPLPRLHYAVGDYARAGLAHGLQ